MRRIKKSFAALALAATLGAAVPAQQASAGILVLVGAIASPYVGLVGGGLIIAGVIYDSWLLIILDENGNVSQTSLEEGLARKYSFIEDSQAISELATLIRAKASAAQPDAEGQIRVSLSEDEILSILEPTGLVESEPELVQAMIEELK